MRVARARGHLRGKQPKLTRRQEAHLVSLVHRGTTAPPEVAELFNVGRSPGLRPSNANATKSVDTISAFVSSLGEGAPEVVRWALVPAR
jgi:hypothetical protein